MQVSQIVCAMIQALFRPFSQLGTAVHIDIQLTQLQAGIARLILVDTGPL